MKTAKTLSFGSDFSRLEQALCVESLSARFELSLRTLLKQELSICEFSVPRVFPGRDGTFTMQYRMKIVDEKKSSSRSFTLGGLLLSEDHPVPPFVETNPGRSFFLDDLRLAVPLFPFDPCLSLLPLVANSPERLKLQGGFEGTAFQTGLAEGGWTSDLLAYRMGKRAVFLISRKDVARSSRGKLGKEYVLKLLLPKKTSRATDALWFLHRHGFNTGSEDRITVPSLIAADKRQGMYVTAMAPGRPLHDLGKTADWTHGCRLAAMALRKLHDIGNQELPELSHEKSLNELENIAQLASGIFPQLNSAFHRSWCKIQAERSVLSEPFEMTCVHTDFHDKQVLIDGQAVTLLDTDSLATGDPALDAGNFMAHLFLRSMQEPEYADNILKGLNAFTEMYFEANEHCKARAGFWERATLVRLAVLYALRPRWRKLTERLLDRVLGGATADAQVQAAGKRG